jgi:hypothetical protein
MAIALAASYGDTWGTSTSPRTASVTVANGDCLIVVALGAGSTGDTITTPTGGSLTYASRIANNTGSRSCFIWSAFPVAGNTFTISLTASIFFWGFIALRYTGVASIGATNAVGSDSASGTNTIPLTTTTDHSAIVMATESSGGWTSATYSTATAGSFTQVATPNSSQANFVGHYGDSGTHGAKTIGTTLTETSRVVAGVELVPSGGSPPSVKQLIVVSRSALVNAYNY